MYLRGFGAQRFDRDASLENEKMASEVAGILRECADAPANVQKARRVLFAIAVGNEVAEVERNSVWVKVR